MLIDSHCHLDYPDFADDGIPAVVDRARQAGVRQMLTISVKLSEWENRVLAAARQSEYIDCTLGLHPLHAHEEAERDFTADDLVRMAKNHPEVVGFGETGLDYYYDTSTIDRQKDSFKNHIAAALELDLPVIIHARDADQDMADMLRSEGQGKLRGVMHCFSSGPDLAKAALDLGFYISISGIVTFKKAEDLREIVKNIVPLDRLLVETDAPYLAPVPMRGKTNEPAFVAHTVRYIADMKDMPVEKLGEVTSENYYSLFKTAERRAPL